MKTGIKNPFRLSALITILSLMLAGRGTAQTFTTLYSFTVRSDGTEPWAGVILSGNTLYGTLHQDGISGYGTVFAVNTDGTGFTNLHSFTVPTSYDGAINPINSDGAGPYAGLVLSGNTLYGTAIAGGSWGNGTVFALNADGTGFTNLHSFAIRSAGNGYPGTNSEGANPWGTLILSGNTLYGTAEEGGASRYGTVFALNVDGTGFRNLHSFTATSTNSSGFYTNSDGAYPNAELVLSGNTLYGTAIGGGTSGYGTAFALNTESMGFTNLYSFTALSGFSSGFPSGNPTPYPGTNSDGAHPFAGLVLSGNMLYGTAVDGGTSGYGTVFALNTDGTGFTNLHSFTGATGYNSFYPINIDGAHPYGKLILSGNTLYGTGNRGGSSGNGTVFSLSFKPQLTIVPAGMNVFLSWPTNVAGFDYAGYRLQSTTNLGSSAVWATNSPVPVIVNGQYTVTNPIAATRQFFRLAR